MKIVVTGASGFVGRHLVSCLSRTTEFEVVAVSRRLHATPTNVQQVVLEDYCVGTPSGDVLIHLAETNNLAAVAENPVAEQAAASARIQGLLENSYRFVLYGSSAAVYGDGVLLPHRPDGPINGRSPYAMIKLACEAQVLAAKGCVLRFANLYGPTMSAQNVMSKILQQVKGDGALRVWDLGPVRDYLWIDDAARCVALMAAAMRPGVYNVGSGIGTSVRTLVSLILELSGQPTREVIATQPKQTVSSLVVDIERTQVACGWKPTTSLELGISRLLESGK
jgi:UDP-glucose 4-epimerase